MSGSLRLPKKFSIVKISGQEGTYFVTNIIDNLLDKEAELKPIASSADKLQYFSTKLLETAPFPFRAPQDYFTSLVIQGLKANIGSFQSAFYCNTIFKHYQLRPLLKFMSNPDGRLLIADEVGLGKTIEAGYIILNEVCRRNISRIVVLCPASLQYKWQEELWNRFGLRFDIVSGKILSQSILNKKKRFYFIASIDCVRSITDLDLSRFCDCQLDMLVIDEIHHLIGRNGDILRRKMGIALSLISNSVIGLTATPIQLEMADLKRILDIIRPGQFLDMDFEGSVQKNTLLNKLYKLLGKFPWTKKEEANFILELKQGLKDLEQKNRHALLELKPFLEDLVHQLPEVLDNAQQQYKIRSLLKEHNTFTNLITRTKRIEVGEERKRTIQNKTLSLNNSFQEANQNGVNIKVSEKSLFNEIDNFIKESFSMVHRRQLYSCLPAMIDLMRSGMKGFNVWTDSGLENVEVKLNEKERQRSEKLADKFGLLRKDSKWEELKKTIRELEENGLARKIIVFTQWIPTIEFFRSRKQYLECPSFVVSGHDKEHTKEKQLEQFLSNDGFCVLFSSDVMSEGLDLQTADCIINYDFPTNPQKIEQRIGRIDRIGQKSDKITIVNLFLDEPLDQHIKDVLVDRIRIFETGLGEIPSIIQEKVEKDQTIDEQEIIRLYNENQTRNKLLNSDLFISLDDELDQVSVMERKGNQEVYNLRWMALERLLFLILGERAFVNKVKIEKNALKLSNFESNDVEALCKTVTIKHRMNLNETIQCALDSPGKQITFKKENFGLFLPYYHPLMQSALAISHKSFFDKASKETIKPLYLKVTKDSKKIIWSYNLLILVEFSYEGYYLTETQWVWFSINNKEHAIEVVKEPLLEKLYDVVSDEKIGLEKSDGKIESWVEPEISKKYETWVQEKSNKDIASSIDKIEGDLLRIKVQTSFKLGLKASKVASMEKIGEKTSEVDRLQKLNDMLHTLQNNPKSYIENATCMRFIAVINAE